jgi:hypothetical protein
MKTKYDYLLVHKCSDEWLLAFMGSIRAVRVDMKTFSFTQVITIIRDSMAIRFIRVIRAARITRTIRVIRVTRVIRVIQKTSFDCLLLHGCLSEWHSAKVPNPGKRTCVIKSKSEREKQKILKEVRTSGCPGERGLGLYED